MIEKIKYCLKDFIVSKQMRLVCATIMLVVTTVVVTLLNCSIYTVNIFDGENTYTVRTLNKNISLALNSANLNSSDYEIENFEFNGKTADIKIKYTFPVYITYGNKTVEIPFLKGTVLDALKKAGFSPDEFDFVEPKLDTQITETVYIDYTDISFVNGEYIEAIPFDTETVYSSGSLRGSVTTLSAGINGSKAVQYTEKFVNGVSVGKNITAENVISAAVNAKQVIGTKVASAVNQAGNAVKTISVLSPETPIALDGNGNPISYKSKMTVQATAYTYTGSNCSTGVAPRPGYIAVNPRVIPYGTKMYIKTADGRFIYGYAIAADTGGFINNRPTGVDLFMHTQSECINFGRRDVEIYILE